MIRICTGLFGVVGLLLGVIPTAALASVSKPTAEERGACMGDAISLRHRRHPQQGAHRLVPGVQDAAAQPAVPGAVRQRGGRPLTTADEIACGRRAGGSGVSD